VLRADVDFGSLLHPSWLADLKCAEDGIDESDGIQTWPPPENEACAPAYSPFSTPPSTPSASTPSASTASLPKVAPTLAHETPPTTPVSTESISARKLKQRAGKKARQLRDRQQKVPNPLWAKVKPALSRIWTKPQVFKAAFSVSELPGTERGFTGKPVHLEARDHTDPWTLQELTDLGFRVIEWDGRWVVSHYSIHFAHFFLERPTPLLTRMGGFSSSFVVTQRMRDGMM
jgi:hypothetical protein